MKIINKIFLVNFISASGPIKTAQKYLMVFFKKINSDVIDAKSNKKSIDRMITNKAILLAMNGILSNLKAQRTPIKTKRATVLYTKIKSTSKTGILLKIISVTKLLALSIE